MIIIFIPANNKTITEQTLTMTRSHTHTHTHTQPQSGLFIHPSNSPLTFQGLYCTAFTSSSHTHTHTHTHFWPI